MLVQYLSAYDGLDQISCISTRKIAVPSPFSHQVAQDLTEPGGSGLESCPFVFAASGVFSMAWKPIRRHLAHRPIVKFIHEQAPRRIPYLPHGSVNPHLVQRTRHPGALSSGFILSSPNNDYTTCTGRETQTVPLCVRSSRCLLQEGIINCEIRVFGAFPGDNPSRGRRKD